MLNRPEILSPAGDMERFLSAVQFGCDAVYLAGESFGMRSSPDNFSNEKLSKAIQIAHSKGIKVYVTCNTLIRNNEVEALKGFVQRVQDMSADAFIVADIGVMDIIQKYAPKTDIHISTQAGVVNYHTARTLWNMGAKRVVLARELSLEEIKTIRDKTDKDLELEAFVHGAMCMSFSGRCLLSNYFTGRDANRGDCCQPCRWKYYLTEETRPNDKFEIVPEKEGTYILNSRDMCMIEHIPELINSGITSFKIEGRAKSAYYVAVVTNAYKKAVEAYFATEESKRSDFKTPDWIVDEVNKISHRKYNTGFYFGGEPGQVTSNGGYIRDYDVVGIVQKCNNGEIKLLQRNKFNEGETIDVLSPSGKPVIFQIDKIYDQYHIPTNTANKAAQVYYIKCDKSFESGSLIRRKRITQ